MASPLALSPASGRQWLRVAPPSEPEALLAAVTEPAAHADDALVLERPQRADHFTGLDPLAIHPNAEADRA
jgi:hypothetical protein